MRIPYDGIAFSAEIYRGGFQRPGRCYQAMKKLIIVTNLGRIRVLKYRAAGEDPIEENHLIEEPELSSTAHVNTIHEEVTDQAGRFGRGGPAGVQAGMSYGEEHNLEREIQRGALKRIAAGIERILTTENNPPWVLTAPQSILASLKQALPTPALKTLVSETGADLTQCGLQEMEKRFL